MPAVLAILLVCLLMIGTSAMASASRMNVEAGQFVAYLWMALWAAVGGLVSFHQKVKAGVTRWLNVSELIGEVATSAFVGVVTGMICEAAQAPVALTYAAIGIAGHAGGRAIFWIEQQAKEWVERRTGVKTGGQ